MPKNPNEVSSFGEFIRKYKLDEFPQLINILLGQMSFVGPRPEVPEFFVQHSDFPQELISLKPGLTGLASLYFFNEESLIRENDSAQFRQWLYMRKKTLNMIHFQHQNLCYDVKIILMTIFRVYT